MGRLWAKIPVAGVVGRGLLIKLCRIMILLALALAISSVYLVRVLPKAAINQISRVTGARLSMEDVVVSYKGEVFIKNLAIAPPSQAEAYDNTILRARHLRAQFAPLSLLRFKPKLQQIELKGFTLDTQFNLDNEQWNMEGLVFKFSGSSGTGTIPTIILDNGVLRYSKISRGALDIAAEIPLSANFQLAPSDPESPPLYQFDIRTGAIWDGIGQSRLQGTWQEGQLVISGGIASRGLQDLERTWSVNAMALEFTYDPNMDYQLKARVRDMTSLRSPDLQQQPPVRPAFLRNFGLATRFQRFVDRYNPSGTIDLELNAHGNLRQINHTQMSGRILCHDINILDRNFPYAIEHLKGQVDFDQDSISSPRLVGWHGSAQMTLNFGLHRSEGIWSTEFHCRGDRLPLDEDFLTSLPSREKEFLSLFDVDGEINTDYHWAKDRAGNRNLHVQIELLDIKGRYHRFPYPLEQLSGSLEIVNDSLTIHDLISEHDQRKVVISGTITPSKVKNIPAYKIRVDAQNIPLDDTLSQAFTENQRLAYRAFNPTGKTDAIIDITSRETGIVVEVEAGLKETSFILPGPKIQLHDVQAQISLLPNTLLLRDLYGRVDQGTLNMNGDFDLDERMKTRGYHLTLNGQDIEIPQLLKFFPATLHERLAPWDIRGTVDAKATMKRSASDQPIQYNAAINLNRNVVTPPFIPASLNQITGTITVNNRDILLENLHAVPSSNDPTDSVKDAGLRMSGRLKVEKNRITEGNLSLLAHRFPVTEGIGATLPQGIEQALRRLAPHGPVSVDIPTLNWTVSPEGQIDARVTLKGSTEQLQVMLMNQPIHLAGSLNLDMRYAHPQGITFGMLHINADKFTYHEKTGQNIQASLVYDPAKQAWITQDITGDFYQGHLMGRLNLDLAGTERQCKLQLTLSDVDLDDLMTSSDPNAPARKPTQGMLNGSLSVSTSTKGTSPLLGRWCFEITQMQAGYVTTLAKILSVLQLSEPQEIVFERILVNSYLKGDTLYLERVDIAGDNVALYGSGEVNLAEEQVNLDLIARGKRLASTDPSVFEALTEGLGGAVIRVEVNGDLYEPTITTKTLPLLEDSLRLFGVPQTP